MLLGSIQQGHEYIHKRLKPPYYIQFGNKIFTNNQHQIFCVNPADIFFVSPALFLWIDTGIQELKSMTSNPDHIKLIDLLLCEMPVVEFKSINENYSHLLMITNLDYNVNLKSKEQTQEELRVLKSYISKIQELFTGNLFEPKK